MPCALCTKAPRWAFPGGGASFFAKSTLQCRGAVARLCFLWSSLQMLHISWLICGHGKLERKTSLEAESPLSLFFACRQILVHPDLRVLMGYVRADCFSLVVWDSIWKIKVLKIIFIFLSWGILSKKWLIGQFIFKAKHILCSNHKKYWHVNISYLFFSLPKSFVPNILSWTSCKFESSFFTFFIW